MSNPYFDGVRSALSLARRSIEEDDYAEAQRHIDRARWYIGRHQIACEQEAYFARIRAEREGIAA